MTADNLVIAPGPAFATGFAVQRLLEFFDPLTDAIVEGVKGLKIPWLSAQQLTDLKHLLLIAVAFAIGLVAADKGHFRVLHNLIGGQGGTGGQAPPDWLDFVVTGLVISAGTEGFNSIMKFIGYKKADAAQSAADATPAPGAAPGGGAPAPVRPAG